MPRATIASRTFLARFLKFAQAQFHSLQDGVARADRIIPARSMPVTIRAILAFRTIHNFTPVTIEAVPVLVASASCRWVWSGLHLQRTNPPAGRRRHETRLFNAFHACCVGRTVHRCYAAKLLHTIFAEGRYVAGGKSGNHYGRRSGYWASYGAEVCGRRRSGSACGQNSFGNRSGSE